MVEIIDTEGIQAPEMPGFVFTGRLVRGLSREDPPLPLYEFAPPAEGHLSINTIEGWQAYRYRCCAMDAERKLGRKPTEDEIHAEMEWNAAEADHIIEELTEEKEPPALQNFYLCRKTE